MRLDLSHTRADIARATLEGLALQLRCVSECMMPSIKCLTLTGGGARSKLMRQIYADVFNVPVATSSVTRHTAALGAAAVALKAIGVHTDYDFISNAAGDREVVYPTPEYAKKYKEIRKDFVRVMRMSAELGKN